MKLSFQYSQIYDELLTYMMRAKYDNKQYLDLQRGIAELEKFWNSKKIKIIKEIERVSGLEFKGNINCYVVKHLGYRAISEPFTIKMNKDFNYITAVIIHELIHILLKDNKKILDLVNKKFSYQNNDFKIHFPVLLIERKAIENLFGEKFFNKVMNKDDHNPDLAYEWQKVNKVYDNFNYNIIKFLEKC